MRARHRLHRAQSNKINKIGLENYQPDDSRETRLLGRFPMRNRFISDWIYEKTGKRRTAKQVGSRLQQLRDTCGGKRCRSPNATVRLRDVRANLTCPIVLKLLTPNRPLARPASLSLSPELQDVAGPSNFRGPPPLRHDTESGSDTSPPSSPTTPTDAHATLQSLLYRGVESRSTELPNSIVFIDLIPHPTAGPSSSHSEEEHLWKERGFQISRASAFPRHLHDIDSTITLLSKSTASARSFFTVYSGEDVVFSEVTSLKPLGPPPGDFDFDNSSSCLYSTSLVPGFWNNLVQSQGELSCLYSLVRIILSYLLRPHSIYNRATCCPRLVGLVPALYLIFSHVQIYLRILSLYFYPLRRRRSTGFAKRSDSGIFFRFPPRYGLGRIH